MPHNRFVVAVVVEAIVMVVFVIVVEALLILYTYVTCSSSGGSRKNKRARNGQNIMSRVGMTMVAMVEVPHMQARPRSES
jgi:hypothetical protein